MKSKQDSTQKDFSMAEESVIMSRDSASDFLSYWGVGGRYGELIRSWRGKLLCVFIVEAEAWLSEEPSDSKQ